MPLLNDAGGARYPAPHMPRPTYAHGPWGEAIRYWLREWGWGQADLVRAIQAANPTATIRANTISNAALGRHCRTNTLEQIARALSVAFEDVLVSPERKNASEERKRMIQEAVEAALRTSNPMPDDRNAAWLAAVRAEAKAKNETVTGKVRRGRKKKAR